MITVNGPSTIAMFDYWVVKWTVTSLYPLITGLHRADSIAYPSIEVLRSDAMGQFSFFTTKDRGIHIELGLKH